MNILVSLRAAAMLALAAAAITCTPARADITAKDASGATVTTKAIACASGVQCPAHVNVNSAGAEVGTSSAPFYIASGTIGAATDAKSVATDATAASMVALLKGQIDRLQAVISAVGSPLQAGGTIGNTAFGISGTLPAFASTPTVNLGTVPSITIAALPALPAGANALGTIGVTSSALPTGAATAANQTAANTSLAAIASAAAGSVFVNGATGTGSALASSGTYTGASRDSGIAAGTQHGISYFNAFFLADQAGTARVDCSNDATTWYTCATASLTAATPLILSMPVMTRYHRAVVVNGATAETYLWVNTSYTGA